MGIVLLDVIAAASRRSASTSRAQFLNGLLQHLDASLGQCLLSHALQVLDPRPVRDVLKLQFPFFHLLDEVLNLAGIRSARRLP